MPSQLWAETDCEMVERRPEGEGELATEDPEEQQHAEHQSSPSPRQWQVSPNYILLGLALNQNSTEFCGNPISSPATHAAPVMATMKHKTVSSSQSSKFR